jgi:DNA repair protein RecO (recombination protein O)
VRPEPTDAILLRSVDYGDADRIVTLLTVSLGKVSAIAKAARKSQRRFAGALEPYAIVRASIAPGRGEVGRLAEAHVVRAHPRILGSLDAMTRAGAALELVREIVPPREPDERMFRCVVEMLEALDAPGAAATGEEIVLAFVVRVMALAGFGASFDACGRCGKRAAAGQAGLFDARRGAVVCRACGGAAHHLSGLARTSLAAAVRGSWLDGATALGARDRTAVRSALADFVAAHLGEPLAGFDALASRAAVTAGRVG